MVLTGFGWLQDWFEFGVACSCGVGGCEYAFDSAVWLILRVLWDGNFSDVDVWAL